MCPDHRMVNGVKAGNLRILPLRDGLASYQLVGGVTAYQGV